MPSLFEMKWEFIIGVISVVGFVGMVFLFWANHFAQPKIIATELKALKARVEEFFTMHAATSTKVSQLAEDVSYMRGLFQATPKLAPARVIVKRQKSKGSKKYLATAKKSQPGKK